ncbi:MAG: GNAT family N-acetyltransferase [Filifactor alocis]|nr:GNAT family N-acetyltransferase [Filifactor alocis]
MIRKMKIEDYGDLYDLWLSCTGMGLNNLDDSEEGIARFIDRNPDTCFVWETKEGEIRGAILAGNDGRRGYIYHTAVHPDYRCRGIAGELLERTMSSLQEIGINKVALVVFEKNDVGNFFWENRGFTKREDLVYRNKTIREAVRTDT